MTKKIAAAMSLRDTRTGLFELASGIARKTGAELLVVSIIRAKDIENVATIASFGYPVSTAQYVKEIVRERMNNLRKILNILSFPENRLKTIIKPGDPVPEFLSVIKDENIDMVVVGKSAPFTLEGLFRSSFSRGILRKSPVTVMVGRKPTFRWQAGRITLTVPLTG